MVPLLVSVLSLEEVIETSIAEVLGSCFVNIPAAMVGRMVDHYNYSGSDGIVDAIIGSPHYTFDEYDTAELFARLFIRLIESNADPVQHLVTLEHWPSENTVVVKQTIRPPQNPVEVLMEVYHHAIEQGDYYPERLRRAFDEVSSSM